MQTYPVKAGALTDPGTKAEADAKHAARQRVDLTIVDHKEL